MKRTSKKRKKNFVYRSNNDPMKQLFWGVYPIFEIIGIARDVSGFTTWLKKEHNQDISTELFHGYKFYFECAFSCILDSLYSDNGLGLKSDFLLESSGKDIVYLGKLPNSCQKTIFLKNVYYHFKPVQRSKNADELVIALNNFHQNVIAPFNDIYKKCVSQKKHPKLTAKEIYNLHLLEKVYLFFTQLNNNGPVAYMGTLMKQYWIPKNKLQICFEGYKLIVQFTWEKLLGSKAYNKSCIKDIHKTKSWYGFIYNEPEKDDDDLALMINRTFDQDKQTSFDAFFYRIRNELMWPLEKKKKISISHLGDYFKSNKLKYSKLSLKPLLKTNLAIVEPNTTEDVLDMMFYWYPMEIVGPGGDNSVAAFITMVTGVFGLLNEPERELKKVHLRKFKHPRDDKGEGRDYSYAILLDVMAAARHYSSEWFLYYDCCGDYSGASGSEQRRVEEVIEKLRRKGIVEFQELEVSHEKFKKYISKYIGDNPNGVIKASVAEVEEKLNKIEEEKEQSRIITDSQGLLLELVSYYLVSKKAEYSKYTDKKWNTNVAPGQIDIVMQNDSEVKIIECKLNPHTLDFDEEIKKLNKKVDSFKGKTQRSFEFWFWYEPNEAAKKKLAQLKASYYSLQEVANLIPRSLKIVLNHQV